MLRSNGSHYVLLRSFRIGKTGFRDVEVLSREQMKVGNSDEWKGLRDLLNKSGLSPDDLDFTVVSIRVKARKPA